MLGDGEVGLVTDVQRVARGALTWVGEPCDGPAEDTPMAQVDRERAVAP